MARLLLGSAVLSRFALLAIAFAGLFVAASPADEVVRIMAANITSGSDQSYDPGHGNRIFQGLDPDIALVQEMNVGSNSTGDYRAWVTANFGASFSYFVESGKSIPNGIVSRYPILASGFWNDPELSDREFVWARIDLPGDMNLLAVSVHLKASDGSTNEARRNNQAEALVDFIGGALQATDHVLIGGDFNTYSRTEDCIGTLSSTFVTTAPWPVDQAGNGNTNSGQSSPYDWVMPGPSLAAKSTPLVIGTNTHANGLVFDSRDYSPLSAVAPVLLADSGATNMQHMAVMRAFLIPTNEAPVVAQGNSVAVTLSKNNTPTAFSRSLNATDVDGDPLTWSIATAAAHGTAGIVAPASGGAVALSYTPATNYTGTDSFVVRVSDGQGGTDTITVGLTIQAPPNVAPVITQGSSVAVALSKNNTPSAFSRSLAATDADADPLGWSISIAAAYGTAGIIVPATGGSVALSYVPVTNYTGTDSFVVQVSDGRGGTDTITVNLSIEEPPNVLPVISAGASVAVTLAENNTPTAFALGLSATDADSDPLSWSIVTAAAHGVANVGAPATGGSVVLNYVPETDYTGFDSFVVQVSDGRGGTDAITVNLTIEEPPNEPPVIAGPAEVSATFSQGGHPVAFSQELSATDPDSDPLTWSVISAATHGSANVIEPASGGTVALKYEPAPGYVGSDTFIIQVSDGRGGADEVVVQITVESPPAYDAWTSDHFSPLVAETEDTLWGEDADPDEDGYSNLEEFAYGLDPSVVDAAPSQMTLSREAVLEGHPVVIAYRIRMDGPSPALSYVVETTANPAAGWTTLSAEEYSLTGESDLGGDFRLRTIQLTDPSPPAARFFRLRFER